MEADHYKVNLIWFHMSCWAITVYSRFRVTISWEYNITLLYLNFCIIIICTKYFYFHSRLVHLAILHLHWLSHTTSIALQSHFLVAHFPLHAQGLIFDSLSLLTGKAGLLNRDFRFATTCSFDCRSFPAKYCSTNDLGSTGSTVLHLHEILLFCELDIWYVDGQLHLESIVHIL